MLKQLLLSAAICAPVLAAAQTGWPSLTLELSDGSRQALPAEGLSIMFSGSSLLASYPGGTFQTPTSGISKFYFSADPAGIGSIGSDEASEAIDVYAISGVKMGSFPSVDAARAALPAGLYIMKSGSQTFKTTVKR